MSQASSDLPPDVQDINRDAYEGRFPQRREPLFHISDVRTFLGAAIIIGACILVGSEVHIATTLSHTTDAIERNLDAFGLFDAAIFAIAGTVIGFYFGERGRSS